MYFYLKVINPIIALTVALLCFWAATYTEDEFKIEGIVTGGMNTYFFAKGLFSASAVYLLGRILLEIVSGRANKATPKYKTSEFFYLAGLLIIIVCILVGILLFQEEDEPSRSYGVQVNNPKEISIIESHRIKESRNLRVTGKLKNNSDFDWSLVYVYISFFVDGVNYCDTYDRADTFSLTPLTLAPGKEAFFEGTCSSINASDIKGNVTYKLRINANRIVKNIDSKN